MALVLGLRIGEKVYIDDCLVQLVADDSQQVSLEVRGLKYPLSDAQATEVLPDVLVSLGRDCRKGRTDRTSRTYRIAFQAPIEIKIYREVLKQAGAHQ